MKKIRFTWYKNMSELNKHRLWKYLFYLSVLINTANFITASVYYELTGKDNALPYILAALAPVLLLVTIIVENIHLNHPYPKKKSLS